MNNKKIVADLLALTFVLGGAALPNTVVNNSVVASASAEEVLTYGGFKYTLLKDGTAEITGYNGKDTKIEIPAEIDGVAVTSIGENAFEYSGIESIVIPDSVENIEECAFYGCQDLKNVILPQNLKIIGACTFIKCPSLESITLPDSLKCIKKDAFFVSGIKSIVIPDSVEKIEDFAFSDCDDLKSVTIPKSVTEIGEGVFSGSHYVTINCYANSAAEKYAIANGLNYELIDEKLPACPPPYLLRAVCSEEYHQIRFKWDPIKGAEKYGIAVYLSGKWKVWTSSIPASTTTFTTPKNLTPGRTYKVAMSAKVNGKWNTTASIKKAITVTVK